MEVVEVETISSLEDPLIVDVRSPGEYEEDHLPGAINLPVLTDAERDRIGTIYNQESEYKARREGAKSICLNVPSIVDEIDSRVNLDDPVLVYCWRGGQRSQSLSIILDRIGYNVFRLKNGYKAYRKHVHDFLRDSRWNDPLVTLYGLTGTGKTNLLKSLSSVGESVLDLEACARHRGSTFGGIGLSEQPTQKTFERELYLQLRNSPSPIFTEGESRKIGRRTLPDQLFDEITEPPRVWIEAPIERRIKVIKEEYPWPECRDELIHKTANLKERLGTRTVESLQDKLRQGLLDEAIKILLEDYYDPAYRRSSPSPDQFDLRLRNLDEKQTREELIKYGKNFGEVTA